MTKTTGKSGQYHHYTCGKRLRTGVHSCTCKSVPMSELENLIVEHVASKLLTPSQLATLMEG